MLVSSARARRASAASAAPSDARPRAVGRGRPRGRGRAAHDDSAELRRLTSRCAPRQSRVATRSTEHESSGWGTARAVRQLGEPRRRRAPVRPSRCRRRRWSARPARATSQRRCGESAGVGSRGGRAPAPSAHSVASTLWRPRWHRRRRSRRQSRRSVVIGWMPHARRSTHAQAPRRRPARSSTRARRALGGARPRARPCARTSTPHRRCTERSGRVGAPRSGPIAGVIDRTVDPHSRRARRTA